MANKKIRILSIDGGGIKGILPGIILDYIEKRIIEKEGVGKRLADYFDMIAGTSTGGILTCLYLAPDKKGRPKFTAEDAVNLYIEKGHEIFDVNFWQRLQTMGGLLDEKYPAVNLEKNLKNYFGDLTLGNMLKPCLVTAYDITRRAAFFFNSVNGKKNDIENFYIKDICRATSAAPTYFETSQVKSLYGASFTFIDGGVFANNPALCAYAEARKMPFGKLFNDPDKPDMPSVKEMMIVSIGTGSTGKPYMYQDAKNWGMIGWLMPLIDILMSGNAETVSYQLKQMFLSLNEENRKDYIRLEPTTGEAKSAMDNATEENIMQLVASGKSFVSEHEDELESIVERLIANK